MTDEESETFQLQFEDGTLVERSGAGGAHEANDAVDRIEPGTRTGFVVEVKSGALEINSQLQEAVEVHGHALHFGSRQHVEDYASQLSASGGSLRVQAVPENESKDIDAYLLADHNPSIKEPAKIDDDTWTFDVGANLYGALGEAIFLHPQKSHALVYFVRQDLDVDEDDLQWGLNVDVTPGRPLSINSSEGTKRWTPDCVVEAKDGQDGELLERYYCEIKAGGGSFERSQIEVMETLVSDKRVLKIRVIIDDLPDQYSLRIHDVT